MYSTWLAARCLSIPSSPPPPVHYMIMLHLLSSYTSPMHITPGRLPTTITQRHSRHTLPYQRIFADNATNPAIKGSVARTA